MATEQSVLAVIRASRPSFRNPYDKMAFAVHASFLAAGYVLHATGPPAFSDKALSSSTTDEVGIDQWNEFEDEYAFLYSHPGKGSEKVLLKCLAMNGKLLVDSVRDGGPNPVHLEISVGDYDKENSGTNYGSLYKDLDKLVKAVDSEILSKLYDSPKQSSKDQPSSSDQQSRSSTTRDVIVTEPQSDPYYPGARSIFPDVGGSDLFPGPGAGMYPNRGDFGGGRGGMFVGPDHPMFGGLGRGHVGPGFPGGLPGVPPGARFDPFGPPGVPGFEPNRFVRHPRNPGGGTHPDLEHFGDGNDFI